MHRLMQVLLPMAVAALLAACGGDDQPVAADSLQARSITAGEVEVTVTPTRLDDTGAVFLVVFDTHSDDLDLDVATHATLTIDGRTWANPTWDGDGPGGHHREGTLRFEPTGPATGEAVLTIDGLDDAITPRWALPDRR